MGETWLSRLSLLVGAEAVETLENSRVAVFGLGGVGSYAAEALARCGVGALVVVDGDVISKSNINRQLYALNSTVGRKKTDVARERISDINPKCVVAAHDLFYMPEHGGDIIEGCDVVIDAIDTVTSKAALAAECDRLGIPLLSSMGTGNKRNPALLRVGDIYETSGCPLCRVMRRELKKRGIKKLSVVWSPEPPEAKGDASDLSEDDRKVTGRLPPASCAFVPPTAGLLLASEAVRIIIDDRRQV